MMLYVPFVYRNTQPKKVLGCYQNVNIASIPNVSMHGLSCIVLVRFVGVIPLLRAKGATNFLYAMHVNLFWIDSLVTFVYNLDLWIYPLKDITMHSLKCNFISIWMTECPLRRYTDTFREAHTGICENCTFVTHQTHHVWFKLHSSCPGLSK